MVSRLSSCDLPVIAILGYGKMGEALGKGILNEKISRRLLATDELVSRVDAMRCAGIEVSANNSEAVRQADIVILAVEPNRMNVLFREIAEAGKHHLVVSIAAGVKLDYLERKLPSARFIRAMPNIAVAVDEGITALARGKTATVEDLEHAKRIFDSVGRSIVLDEELMDTVTGLSGSGPAYIFFIIDALVKGALGLGMPYQIAVQLAAQTTLGAARMVLELGKHPDELKEMVTTPGGTTVAGLSEMEKAGMKETLIRVVEAASKRANQMSNELANA